MKRLRLSLILITSWMWAQGLPEVYRLYIDHDYEEARLKLETMLAKEPDFEIAQELGDLYLDKLGAYTRAESLYGWLIDRYPGSPSQGEVYYRLGLARELSERWIDAAQAYQEVIIRSPKCHYAEDASTAIERCFKKNYQDRIALIDDYPITRLEFDELLAQMPESRRAHYASDEGQKELLDDLIKSRLLWIEAQSRRLDTIPKVAERLSQARDQILLRELYKLSILDKVVVSEEELRRYYEANQDEFRVGERVRARELKVESRAEADSLYTLLLEGSKFDSLARERSIAPSKARGGDLGFLQKGRHPELDSVIFALSPGELSPVLELPDGYVIVTVEERIPAQLQSFEQVQSRIDERLRRQKLNQVYERYTKELMSAAQIERFEAGDTLALVNSHPITEQEFEARVAQLPPFARSGLDTPEGRSQFLDQLILERLLRERAEAEDLWLREPVQAQLRSARQAILVRELYRLEVIEPSSVDSNQVRDYYEANQDEFRVGERVRARELKVGSRAEADSLYRYLTRRPGILGWILGPPKVDFDSLARERSVAPTKAKGGDLGYFTRDEKPEIAAVAFKLKPGQISKVIPVEDGFVILKVDARNPSRIKPLSEVFNQIQGRLRTERQKELEAELYSRLRGEHQIQTFLSE